MNNDIAQQINKYIREIKNENDIIEKINKVLSITTVEDQLSLHGSLNVEAIKFIYHNLESLFVINDDVKEHILWKYYINLKENDFFSEDIIRQILNDYKANRYVALESLIVDALKLDRLTPGQFDEICELTDNKTINKEIFASKCRKNINEGGFLKLDEVTKLLNNRSYSVIQLAISKQQLEEDAIMLLIAPYEGQVDKKVRLQISCDAKKMLSKIRGHLN